MSINIYIRRITTDKCDVVCLRAVSNPTRQQEPQRDLT